MKNITRSLVLVAVVATLWLVPSSFAGSVQFALTGGGPTHYGEETGPYTATLDGVQKSVFCDDIKDSQNIGSTYLYDVTNFNQITYGSTTNVMFGNDPNAQLHYQEAAWLMIQMAEHGAQTDLYSFAIWDLFDNASVASKVPATTAPGEDFNYGDITTAVNAAAAAIAAGADVSYAQFYTPSGCAGLGVSQSCQPGGPGEQEFGRVPEGGSALAYSLLVGIACFGALFISRRQTAMGGLA